MRKDGIDNMTMNRENLLALIKDLAKSQGYYGRMLAELEGLKVNDPSYYEEVLTAWENQHFDGPIDFIMYMEE